MALVFAAYYYRKLAVIRYLLMFMLGLLYALLACQHQLDQQINTAQTISFSAYVDTLPRSSEHKTSFLSTDTSSGRTWLMNAYHNDSATWPDFRPGEYYHFTIYAKPPHGMANGVGFDRERWLFRHHIDGTATIKHAKLANRHSPLLKHRMHQWRAHIGTLIDQAFTTPRVNGLIRALSIGDKSRIASADYKIFHDTGTAHLIAISGLHIGMVASFGWLLGWLWFCCFPIQRINRPTTQVILALTLALAYAILAGFAVSTQRALIMLAVYAIFKIYRRQAFAWDVWSVSLMVVLLLDPLHVLDAGFWLSFIAVAVLILAFHGTKQLKSKPLNYLKMQWTLMVGMLPLNLSTFSTLKLSAPLINFIMIPLMTVLIVPALLLMLLVGSVLDFFPTALIYYLNQVCQGFLWLLDQFNQLAWLQLKLTLSSPWQLGLITLACLILVLPRAIAQRSWAVLLLFFMLLPNNEKIATGHFKVDFLDVGQGLSVLLSTQNHHLLYDVGAAYPSGFNVADAVIIPTLIALRINHLDRLIISHRDNDHAGALPYLLSQIKVKSILSTEAEHSPCVSGTSWTWDGVLFEIISPYNTQPYLKNNSSCVLKITGVNTRLMLTGDIESAVEYRLIQQTEHDIQTDVLLIPHHGSNTSSTAEFITNTNPLVAINSSGRHNPFGHPKPMVINRYEDQDVAVMDTQHSGKINLSTDPELQLEAYRTDNPRIWRTKKPE